MKKTLIAAALASVFLVGGCAAQDRSLSPACNDALDAATRLGNAAKSATSVREDFITALRTNDVQKQDRINARLALEEGIVANEFDNFNALRDQCEDTNGFE